MNTIEKKIAYAVMTNTGRNRIWVQCVYTDKAMAEDALMNLRYDKPEYFHFLQESELYLK